MKRYSIFILLFCIYGYSQDKIVLKNDTILKVEMLEVFDTSCQYKSVGEGFEVKKLKTSEIHKVIYESGLEDVYFVPYNIDELSLKEIKEILPKEINLHCFHEDSKKKRFSIDFEGDFINFKVKEGNGVLGRGILFDFSEVYKFYDVSKRTNTRAYINVMVKYLKNKKRNIWHKRKLIMRVKGHQNAYRITALLKRYNKLITD